MLQNIIQRHKHFIIIVCAMIGFLIVHNQAYCDLSFFQKWYQNTENYFLTLTWEKAISDPIELSKSVGWVSVGAIGSLYAFEGIWNIRRLGSIVLYRYTPFGHLDDGSGIVKSWFGFRNTAGPLKNIIDTVPYEEILPLHLARNYVFPYIFIPVNSNRTNTAQIDPNTNPRTETTSNSLAIRPNIPEITSINNVEPQIVERIREVNHYFEVPVYIKQYVPVPKYKDRENLQSLDSHVQALNSSVQDLKLVQAGLKDEAVIAAELTKLTQFEGEVCLTLKELKKKYEYFNMPGVSEDTGNYPTKAKISEVAFKLNGDTVIYYELPDKPFIVLRPEQFAADFPILFNVGNALAIEKHQGSFNQTHYINLILGYNIKKIGYFSQTYNIDPYNSFFQDFGHRPVNDASLILELRPRYKVNAIQKIKDYQLQQIMQEESKVDYLVQTLNEKISNEQRLINIETTDQGTQTMDFSINDMFFDEINSYLEIQDQTSFIVASRDGQNLPFNELNEANTQAGIEMMKKYKKTKIVKKQALKEQEALLQAEPLIQEGVDTASSNLFQNMATLFSVVLVGAVVHDPQTVDVLAKTLLGFTHLPEYNQAFLAATHMSIADLQMEYNFGPEEARRAYDAIGQAYDIRHPGSSLSDISSNLSNSNDYLDQAQKMSNSWGWKDYLLFTGGIVIACGTLYYVYQSVKTGTPVENIQNISPNVEVWKNAYFEKINKL